MAEKIKFLISMDKHHIKSPYAVHSTLIHLVLTYFSLWAKAFLYITA